MAKTWSRIRAEAKRREIGVYGFRIAEPQHDGTPHWHCLLFRKPEHASALKGIVRKHALKDCPNERGANEHRCDLKQIDSAKGSAAGYIAKYVAKNIDGAHVGEDLHGKPAQSSAVRVEAWATRWGIRQFQQIGGAPVGVWRELRRVHAVPASASQYLRDAHAAANNTTKVEGRENMSVACDRYCEAQGGVFCGRGARIELTVVTAEKLGRYGDEPTPRPVGIETSAVELYAVPWDPAPLRIAASTGSCGQLVMSGRSWGAP